MKNKKACLFGRQGFTLIELLVVIAIIGLLSTLAVVSLNNARSKARDARRTSDLKAMQSAVELYRGDSSTDLIPAIALGNAWSNLTTLLANYLPAGAPIDPGSNFYIYCANTAGGTADTRYIIGATLENNATSPGLQGTVSATTYVLANDCVKSTAGAPAALPTCNATTGFCLGSL